jgi:hypothetical protein
MLLYVGLTGQAALKIKLDGSSGKGPNSARLAELRSQLDAIKEYVYFSFEEY